MRSITPLFSAVASRLRDALAARVSAASADGVEIDVLAWTGRTALELVGQAGLGHSFDSFEGETADEYGEAIKALS